MSRGIVTGVIAGYFFLAFIGANVVPNTVDDAGALTVSNNGMLEVLGGILGVGTFVGFVLHIIISAVIGAFYTSLFTQYLDLGGQFYNIVVGGAIYGLIWWIIGGNIMLPMLAGAELLQLSIGASFYGHLVFGHVLAFLVVLQDAALGYGYEHLPKLKHPAGYNYNILDSETGLTKIGRTVRPKERLRELRNEHGKQLRYSSLRESENAPKKESRLHKKFASRRKDGEWFDLS